MTQDYKPEAEEKQVRILSKEQLEPPPEPPKLTKSYPNTYLVILYKKREHEEHPRTKVKRLRRESQIQPLLQRKDVEHVFKVEAKTKEHALQRAAGAKE